MSLNRWASFSDEELEILSEALSQVTDSNLAVETEAVENLADEIDHELFVRDSEAADELDHE